MVVPETEGDVDGHSTVEDDSQNVARSAFADMLHDTERNELYERGIEWAIRQFRDRGVEKIIVLDIGTGSGILSMLALRHGADEVYACDSFPPAIEAARRVTEANGFSGRIKFISKSSLDVLVGSGRDMETRAHILVTELFDTELIGEGAIMSYDDARSRLLRDDCLIVPQTATIFVQLAHSDFLRRHHNLELHVLRSPAALRECSGTTSLHDLQLSQLDPTKDMELFGEPRQIFHFDFQDVRATPELQCLDLGDTFRSGKRKPCVLMWWECTMCPGVVLSCAPHWVHPQGEEQPWRDHWMQAVYYPSHDRGRYLICNRDDYSFWFDLCESPGEKTPQPFCSCGVHFTTDRSRIAQLGDLEYLKGVLEILEKDPSEKILLYGERLLSMPAFLAKSLPSKTIYYWDKIERCRQIAEDIALENNLKNCVSFDRLEHASGIQSVFCEPFHDLEQQWHYPRSFERFLGDNNLRGAKRFPERVQVWAVWVDFENLWKIRAPIKQTVGFDLRAYDSFIQGAIADCDTDVELQPLWEYPCSALSEPILISGDARGEEELVLERPVESNGVVLWCQFDGDGVMHSGPVEEVVIGEKIQWNRYLKQSVILDGERSSYTIHLGVNEVSAPEQE